MGIPPSGAGRGVTGNNYIRDTPMIVQVSQANVWHCLSNYQKIVKDVLRDCKGAVNIADDVIVHGRGVKEHDENLFTVLNRLKECGLTLNGGKCKFRLPRLTFYGHDLGKQGITPSEEKIDAIVNAQSPKNASEVR